MSVAGVCSSSFGSYDVQGIQNRRQQFRQDFDQLGKDLQSGNLSAAQSDFATLQALRPNQSTSTSSSASTISTTTQGVDSVPQEFQQLSKDLQSGDVASAQQDFSKIRHDFQSKGAGAAHGHHHHGGCGGGSEISALMEQLNQFLQSGDSTTAQQAYTTLSLK